MNLKKYRNLIVASLSLLLVACSTGELVEQDYTSVQIMDLRDDDKDGVINGRDICAETPLTSQIDGWGCSEWEVEYKSEDYVFNFGFDKNKIMPEHRENLEKILGITSSNHNARVYLVGDTSSEGSDEYNTGLGKRRAYAIIHDLVANGLEKDRIVGYVYNDKALGGLMQKRERRTIVRLVYHIDNPIKKWNVYTAEEERKEQL
jgi:outer membrane protein OmpA-like peptidoglycan-associated protein